ncbi:MAG TPA: translocation/assembly module TamB domain-containing protein [Nitrospirota bacterium]
MRKILIIISVLLFALLAAVELYVQSDDFAVRIRPYVAEPLRAALGEGATIGWVRANFIPLYVEAGDISVPDANGKQIAGVHKLKVYINPLPLLYKKIRLSSISLLDPSFHAERAKDGAINFLPLVDRIKSYIKRAQQGGASRFSVLLRAITVKNGQILANDDMTSTQFSISGINMAVRVDLSQERGRVVIRNSRARFSAPAYPELVGGFKAALEFSRGGMHLESAELSTADASLAVAGDVGPLPDPVLDLRVNVKTGPKIIRTFADFLRPARKREAPRIEAAAVIRGKVSDPIIEGSLKASPLTFRGMALQNAALSFAYRNGNLSARGGRWKLSKGDRGAVIDNIDADLGYRGGSLDIRRLEVRAGDLSLRLGGRADPSTGFDVYLSADSSGEGKTISVFTSLAIAGAAGVRGKLSGTFTSPRFDGAVAAGPVTVRGVLFDEVRGGLSYADKKMGLSSVDIREQSSRYVLDGTADFTGKEPRYTARLRVAQSDVVNIVALFYKHLPLRLSAEGDLSFEGTAKNYSGSGYLKLAAGSAYGESFTRGAVTARLSTGKIAFPQVVLYKGQGVVKATGWIGFDGTYSADLESRDMDLSAIDRLAGMPAGGGFKLTVHSFGSFTHPFARASIEVEALAYRQTSIGAMNAEAEIKDGLLSVTAGLSEKRADLSVRWILRKPYSWAAEARIKSDAIDPFLVIGNKDMSGRVNVIADGAVSARGRGTDPASLVGSAVFKKLSLVIGDFRIENESDANLSLDGGRIAVASLHLAGPGTRIGVTGWARPLSDIDLTLKGTADLSLLKLLYRDAEYTRGAAEFTLTAKDSWKNPDITGELRLRNGEIKVKDIPQRFAALNGSIAFSQGRLVVESMAGEMGGGSLNVSGWVQLAGLSFREISAKAAVDNVTVRYPEGLVSTLSGDLYYDGDASEQALSGDVTIRKARYDKRIEWKTMLVDIGRGLYQKKKTEARWVGDTRINVRFHGANSILFQNNLATMPLDVDVSLRGTVNHPQLLGRIEARKGVVYFRKNEFKILNASADFTDPNRINPVLDIQAETRVREYQIRLAVTGTADRAVVTLISEPSLIDSDILALLALGKTGAELKGKETGVGVGEATSFASGQFQDFLERHARSLTGLDRFQIDPYVGKSDTSVPRVTVGKELVQNKLYVTYSSNVGATAPEQIFRIEYLLDKHFSLVGERNETGNTGADITYRFEFK